MAGEALPQREWYDQLPAPERRGRIGSVVNLNESYDYVTGPRHCSRGQLFRRAYIATVRGTVLWSCVRLATAGSAALKNGISRENLLR
jgi:hypothetical protein